MGFDVMASWDRLIDFEFNDQIQRRGGIYHEKIPFDSPAGRTILRDDYKPPTPTTPTTPTADAAPTFQVATKRWSPPSSPRTMSIRESSGSPRRSSPAHLPVRSTSPRVDSARALETPPWSALSAKDKNRLADKLHAAACSGDLDNIEVLLSLGANVNAATIVEGLYEAFKPAKSGRLSALAGAAGNGQLDAVELLLANGATLNPDVMVSSSSPLHQACRNNDVEIARLLLELGANVNMNNAYKTTPLMYAVKYGSAELVRTVLEFKPNLNMLSFIDAAAIHWAIWPGKVDIVKLLLKAGANPNHPMANGSTPLHCAATSGHEKITKCLLRYGADPVRRNEEWKTPLQVAEEHGYVEISRLLREAALRKQTL